VILLSSGGTAMKSVKVTAKYETSHISIWNSGMLMFFLAIALFTQCLHTYDILVEECQNIPDIQRKLMKWNIIVLHANWVVNDGTSILVYCGDSMNFHHFVCAA
jgi:hypothetical protein